MLEAVIHTETCAICKTSTRHVESLLVWSKTRAGDILDPWAVTAEVKSAGMREFHSDLPVRTIERDRYIPACADCIDILQERRPWKN